MNIYSFKRNLLITADLWSFRKCPAWWHFRDALFHDWGLFIHHNYIPLHIIANTQKDSGFSHFFSQFVFFYNFYIFRIIGTNLKMLSTRNSIRNNIF
jgi:hypothetical protein